MFTISVLESDHNNNLNTTPRKRRSTCEDKGFGPVYKKRRLFLGKKKNVALSPVATTIHSIAKGVRRNHFRTVLKLKRYNEGKMVEDCFELKQTLSYSCENHKNDSLTTTIKKVVYNIYSQ